VERSWFNSADFHVAFGIEHEMDGHVAFEILQILAPRPRSILRAALRLSITKLANDVHRARLGCFGIGGWSVPGRGLGIAASSRRCSCGVLASPASSSEVGLVALARRHRRLACSPRGPRDPAWPAVEVDCRHRQLR